MKIKNVILLTILAMGIASCTKEKRHADLKDIDLKISIERFDSAFWTMDTSRLDNDFDQLLNKYPDITPVYLTNVVRFGDPDAEITRYTYKLFRNDSNMTQLYSDVLKRNQNLNDIEQELTMAFRRAKYFFPQLETPRLYAHVSGFNQSIVIGDGFLSLSLDNYMGEDYPLYELAGIYNYQRPNMCREKIASDYIIAWLSSEFPAQNYANKNLLSDIIYHGKILYATSLLLPDTPERIVMGYTKEQWEWAKRWEHDMWGTLMENKQLFATDLITRGRYTNDGPFTRPFTQESPGRAGAYLGWQIVEAYMAKNTRISPMQLFAQSDAQLILSQSNYRP